MEYDPKVSVLNKWSQSHDLANRSSPMARACDAAVTMLQQGVI
jgi:hypothetical protein